MTDRPGLVPLPAGVYPGLAWAVRGIIWPVIAILVVGLGGFRGLDNPAADTDTKGVPEPA